MQHYPYISITFFETRNESNSFNIAYFNFGSFKPKITAYTWYISKHFLIYRNY